MQSYKSKLSHFFCKLLLHEDDKIPLLGTNSFFFPDCCGGDDFEAADLPLQASARGPAGDKIVIVVAVEDNPVTQVA